MARKRMRRRRDPNSSSDMMNQGHTNQPTMINGKMVHIHQIRNTDEGVLYSHSITERGKPKRRSTIKKSMRRLFSKDLDDHSHSDAYSLNSSIKSGGSFSPTKKTTLLPRQTEFSSMDEQRQKYQGIKAIYHPTEGTFPIGYLELDESNELSSCQ
mmetsp:Transcript_8973/g.17873  ORF Transcript_8973/g.17873 Transcript_8973/m.17873 type:complete len:155 (+) Transcript_8973:256-720(+)